MQELWMKQKIESRTHDFIWMLACIIWVGEGVWVAMRFGTRIKKPHCERQ